MHELSVRFGKRVKELRKINSMTQNELAEKAELSKDYIGLIERGLRSPSLQTIYRIADSLEVSISNLFEESSE